MVRVVGLGNPLVEEVFSAVSTQLTANVMNRLSTHAIHHAKELLL
jgi:hypothetical protein